METNKKSSFSKLLLIGLIVAQFGVIIYLLYSNNTKSTEIQELTTTVDTKSVEMVAKMNSLDSLETEFNRISKEREALGLSNDTLNLQLEELKQFKKKALASGSINAKEKRMMEEMIAKFKADVILKDQEIAELKTANTELEGQVSNLSTEKAKLGDSLSGVATVKKDLENQLAYASILKAEQFKISAIKENGKEYVDEEYKASKISQIKAVFTISDNKAAKQGLKDFFIAIVPPSGTTFSDPLNGGGELTTAEGETKSYTFKQNVNFSNNNETISFLIPKGFNYVAGQYKVIAFCEGYNIGQGKFTVK